MNNNRENARQLVLNDVRLLRDFAKILTSDQVRAVLAKFDGKIINARLDSALSAAAGEVVPGASLCASRGRFTSGVYELFERGKCGGLWGAYYKAPNGPSVWLKDMKAEDLATGARLDASALRAEFDRVAEYCTGRADEIEKQLGNFGEWERRWLDLCRAGYLWIYGENGDHSDTLDSSLEQAFGMDLQKTGWYFDWKYQR